MENKTVKPLFEQMLNEAFWTIISGSSASPVVIAADELPVYTYPEFSNVQGIRSYSLEDTIKSFAHLEHNWDSYNADRISDTAINTALEILNFLKREDMFSKGISIHVFPMRDGGIQFEFDSATSTAELEINPQGEMNFIIYDEDDTVWDTMPIYLYELSELKEQLEAAEYAE